MGRTTITASATTRPGSFLGFDESYHSPHQSRPPSRDPLARSHRRHPRCPPCGSLPRTRCGAPAKRVKGGQPPPTSNPQKQNRPTPSGRRAAKSQERAGNGLFSARGCPPSIVSAAAFHFRVRDGNGWDHRAPITSSPPDRSTASSTLVRIELHHRFKERRVLPTNESETLESTPFIHGRHCANATRALASPKATRFELTLNGYTPPFPQPKRQRMEQSPMRSRAIPSHLLGQPTRTQQPARQTFHMPVPAQVNARMATIHGLL